MNTTTERVPANTSEEANHWIHQKMERRIAFYAAHRELIEQRLSELDREWDIERLIETEAPMMTLSGILMSAMFGRKWLLLPMFAQSMVLTHALQGIYPLLPLFRKAGFRTQAEIAAERYALKALRGDFKNLGNAEAKGDAAYQASRIM